MMITNRSNIIEKQLPYFAIHLNYKIEKKLDLFRTRDEAQDLLLSITKTVELFLKKLIRNHKKHSISSLLNQVRLSR